MLRTHVRTAPGIGSGRCAFAKRVKFLRVTLDAPAERLGALREFYGDALELRPRAGSSEKAAFGVGETELEFRRSERSAFYHFALLVPGDRFDAAHRWAASLARLLVDDESGADTFVFDSWRALASYFEDPAGNIVELIAHRGLERTGAAGDFHGSELVGVSELGLVGDPRALARTLASAAQLHVWDGTLDEPGQLAFVGEPGRTLILTPVGRGWLPTGRPSEPHPLDVAIAGPVDADVELNGGLYRLVSRAR